MEGRKRNPITAIQEHPWVPPPMPQPPTLELPESLLASAAFSAAEIPPQCDAQEGGPSDTQDGGAPPACPGLGTHTPSVPSVMLRRGNPPGTQDGGDPPSAWYNCRERGDPPSGAPLPPLTGRILCAAAAEGKGRGVPGSPSLGMAASVRRSVGRRWVRPAPPVFNGRCRACARRGPPPHSPEPPPFTPGGAGADLPPPGAWSAPDNGVRGVSGCGGAGVHGVWGCPENRV